jgi:hypothetical protein
MSYKTSRNVASCINKVLKERVLPCCMCTSNIEINSQVFNKQNVTYIQCI